MTEKLPPLPSRSPQQCPYNNDNKPETEAQRWQKSAIYHFLLAEQQQQTPVAEEDWQPRSDEAPADLEMK